GIVVAEFFTAISGRGGMIVEYANVFATAKLFVPIIVIALVGVVLTEFVMWLERRMSRWGRLGGGRFLNLLAGCELGLSGVVACCRGRLMEESGSPTDVSGSGQVSHSR